MELSTGPIVFGADLLCVKLRVFLLELMEEAMPTDEDHCPRSHFAVVVGKQAVEVVLPLRIRVRRPVALAHFVRVGRQDIVRQFVPAFMYPPLVIGLAPLCRGRVLLARAVVSRPETDCVHWIPAGKPGRNYIVSANGGNPQAARPEEQTTNELDPNWSADGTSIAFFSSGTINILDLRTHKVSVVPGSEGFFSPHWSPDGRYIVAMSGAARKLVLFDFKTQKWVELTKVNAAYPNWSRDGSYVYFHSFGSDPALYRVRITDHKLERIVGLKGVRLTIGIAGTWCGLAPDDSPTILRDVGSQEIYALDLQLP